ncbi:hypothetical protein COS50_02660 [Candidatus Roizmanbacteria bacterium CG03_land_8_20_14_0_80_35_26]|uniref:DUF5667 domain-containing protein n=4 Tax=Candidatus Roizmaniibacteriota TaxID=1752723 RepID=A0A2M7BWK5_9BACT|nr:MAG: hypothetical protein COS50_02660 [Candidatus Roizmanbacteria bacterium CG03_land_8_20_14_0_80_35_26]PJC32613.1 MAG: hypothetical protein CO049_02465 [Candidatus Roizmanbacteria bacterium CG_4_9_14_0_2_um_filter_36_12]PJC80630.1 MAG: hypothetical protein CO008_01410 [Candidatus Roizmanbacteria bacterium CG_4_8_14_3_um_filter_36_12]
MKKISRFVLISLFLVIFPTMTYFVMESSGAPVNTPQEKVVYNLPYPGILSDHPLYFLKIVRDRISEFLTRDNVKKTQLYLLYSDKRVAMAMSLAKKGKSQPAIDAFSKGEKYFLKIPELLKEIKKQGGQSPSGFVETLKLSNAKHSELIGELMKTLPEGNQEYLTSLLNLNLEIKKLLETLP